MNGGWWNEIDFFVIYIVMNVKGDDVVFVVFFDN